MEGMHVHLFMGNFDGKNKSEAAKSQPFAPQRNNLVMSQRRAGWRTSTIDQGLQTFMV